MLKSTLEIQLFFQIHVEIGIICTKMIFPSAHDYPPAVRTTLNGNDKLQKIA